jgi:hypothetical protein
MSEQHISPEAADRALERALKDKRGRLTKADAITVSGLPAYTVDESLDRLLGRYKSHLSVTDEGELLYEFEPGLVHRDAPTLAERARAALAVVARGAKWVFKVWITVTLVVYLIAFVALAIAAIFGGDDRNRRDRRSSSSDDGLGWLWWFFMPNWGYGGGYGGGGYRQLPPARRQGGGPKKKFIQSVFDFVFGPPPATPELDRDREALAFLRDNDGRATATDLVALNGWSYPRAEEEAARLMVRYEGEPEITEGGTIVYAFPNLLKTAGEIDTSATWKPYWQKQEKISPPLTGNTSGMDLLIGAFAGFNLFMSFFGAHYAAVRWHLDGAAWRFFWTVFPLTFFTIFLSVPGVRWIGRAISDGKRRKRNRRRELVHEVIDANGAALPDGPEMLSLAHDLEGDPDLDEEKNEKVWRFPRPAEEKDEIRKYLKVVDLTSERRVGQVIFGSEEESPKPLPPAK